MDVLQPIVQFLLNTIEATLPFIIVYEYQQGVMLRGGKYLYTMLPGFHWKIPFYDKALVESVVMAPISLNPQSVTTLDDVNVVVELCLQYEIKNIKLFLLEVEDSIEAISDISQAIVKRFIGRRNWEECCHNQLEELINPRIKEEAFNWGVKVVAVQVKTFGMIKSIRLIGSMVNEKI